MRLSLLHGRARHSVRAVLSLTQLIPDLRRAGDCAPYLIMLLLAWQAARAQTADDFFNGGAHFYISNSIPQALETVEGGMKQYPDDVKLKKLYELLKQQQQQQSQSSQSQQKQDQQNQSQQQKSNGQKNQQQQSQQNSQQQKQDKQEQQQKQQEQQKSGEKPEKQNEQGQPVTAGQMTPEEAKRLLDAQKGSEQFLQLKPQGKPENPNQPIKDW